MSAKEEILRLCSEILDLRARLAARELELEEFLTAAKAAVRTLKGDHVEGERRAEAQRSETASEVGEAGALERNGQLPRAALRPPSVPAAEGEGGDADDKGGTESAGTPAPAQRAPAGDGATPDVGDAPRCTTAARRATPCRGEIVELSCRKGCGLTVSACDAHRDRGWANVVRGKHEANCGTGPRETIQPSAPPAPPQVFRCVHRGDGEDLCGEEVLPRDFVQHLRQEHGVAANPRAAMLWYQAQGVASDPPLGGAMPRGMAGAR